MDSAYGPMGFHCKRLWAIQALVVRGGVDHVWESELTQMM